MKVREIDLGGRRVLRVTAYTFDRAGDDPEARILMVNAWEDDPPHPVGDRVVSFPASVLPELREALAALEADA